MTAKSGQRIGYLIACLVIAIATVGYFVGLQSPMNPGYSVGSFVASTPDKEHRSAEASNTVPASSYQEMGSVTAKLNQGWKTTLAGLIQPTNLLEEIEIQPGQKEFALEMREKNRAFNGAPPTIPHPVDQLNTESCMVCHGNGYRSETFRISKMSHQYLANCTQCHVEVESAVLPSASTFESEFVGLPAPTGGERAFPGAPPTIPHSTWMRVDCNSCHGPTGMHGIRSTHPWRTNCQQCHAPSSKLNQVQLDTEPKLLPPIKIQN